MIYMTDNFTRRKTALNFEEIVCYVIFFQTEMPYTEQGVWKFTGINCVKKKKEF